MNAARAASAAKPWAEKQEAHRAALVGHADFIARVDALLAECSERPADPAPGAQGGGDS